ncbi:MAG: hypothetical protein HC854_10195 [Flavobacterium sp.]|nr:hypothetical protein [Flavobacterium sp.]
MKYLAVTLLTVLFLVSCNSKEEKKVLTPKLVEKKEPIIKEYGFTFNDYKVVRDTIKSGDNLSIILDRYSLPDSLKTFQVVEKVRDSFNPRKIKIGKPYLLFLNKEKPTELQALIYVNNKIEYSVIDFRDSVQVSNKKKPTSIKRRTIAANIEGSLSETLSKTGVNPGLATKLAKVYEYSIDFFKIQKDDKFSVNYLTNVFIEEHYFIAGIESIWNLLNF